MKDFVDKVAEMKEDYFMAASLVHAELRQDLLDSVDLGEHPRLAALELLLT